MNIIIDINKRPSYKAFMSLYTPQDYAVLARDIVKPIDITDPASVDHMIKNITLINQYIEEYEGNKDMLPHLWACMSYAVLKAFYIQSEHDNMMPFFGPKGCDGRDPHSLAYYAIPAHLRVLETIKKSQETHPAYAAALSNLGRLQLTVAAWMEQQGYDQFCANAYRQAEMLFIESWTIMGDHDDVELAHTVPFISEIDQPRLTDHLVHPFRLQAIAHLELGQRISNNGGNDGIIRRQSARALDCILKGQHYYQKMGRTNTPTYLNLSLIEIAVRASDKTLNYTDYADLLRKSLALSKDVSRCKEIDTLKKTEFAMYLSASMAFLNDQCGPPSQERRETSDKFRELAFQKSTYLVQKLGYVPDYLTVDSIYKKAFGEEFSHLMKELNKMAQPVVKRLEDQRKLQPATKPL